MREIYLGIKDYIKDCWNDYVIIPIWERRLKKVGIPEDIFYMIRWKEGSVWHYIVQRRIAKKVLKDSK